MHVRRYDKYVSLRASENLRNRIYSQPNALICELIQAYSYCNFRDTVYNSMYVYMYV